MNYYLEGFTIEASGKAKKVRMVCPKCHGDRTDKRDKSLRVDTETKFVHCYHCGLDGIATTDSDELKALERVAPVKGVPSHFRRPMFDTNKTVLSDEMARYLVVERFIPQEIIQRMMITEEVHFIAAVGKKVKCIGFNYFVDDVLVNTKYRDREKHFALDAGAPLVPWNIDGIKETKQCVLTEGELDAMSIMATGRMDVISVPNGANGSLEWLNPFVESHFENKEIIYIAVDTDKQGLVLRNELLRRFGREKCRIVTYGPDCKDANDHLKLYGVDSLKICLDMAPELPLEGVFTVKDVIEDFRAMFDQGLTHGLSTGFKNLDRYMRFETGMLHIVTGVPGAGKSEFVDMLAINMFMLHDWKTAFFSPENFPLTTHYSKHAEKMVGKKFKKGITSEAEYEEVVDFLKDHIFSIIPKEGFTIENILRKARELVRRKGIKHLVIDPFNCIDHQYSGKDETQYISKFLQELKDFAMNNEVLVTLVAHPRKMEMDLRTGMFQVPNMYSINGSAHFSNKTDYGIAVERNTKTNICTVHVQKVRQRNLGKPGRACFAFDLVNGRYFPCEEDLSEEGLKMMKHSAEIFDSSNWFKKKMGLIESTAIQQRMRFEEEAAEDYEGASDEEEGASPRPELPF